MVTKQYFCTDEEIAYIRRNYKGTKQSKELIAQILNLKYSTVSWQVQKLGLGLKLIKNKNLNQDEKEQLQDLAGRYNNYKIAKIMGKSVNCIKIWKSRLGITKIGRNGWYTMSDISLITGVGYKVIRRWINNNMLYATRYLNNDNPNTLWKIKTYDLRTFIRKYPQELVGKNIDIIQIVDLLSGILNGNNGEKEHEM